MKRIFIILLLIGTLLIYGCTKSNDVPNASKQGGDIADIEAADNPFFFDNGISEQVYIGRFLFDDIVEDNVKLNISEIADLKDGRLYELKLDPVEGIPEDRLDLGYFYVMKDTIYRLGPTLENLDRLKTSEELPDESVIVCQDQESKDTLSEDEPGFHHYVEAAGDKRVYHSYNNEVSTGYYESFTWEKGKGLTNYRSGYGAESEAIELQIKQ